MLSTAEKPIKETKIDEPERMSLRDLKVGDRARILRIEGEGNFRRRLLEMGFTTGTQVLIKKYAPLRDPIELVIKGYHVSLRLEEAEKVLVAPLLSEKD